MNNRLVVLSLSLLLTACGGGSNDEKTQSTASQKTASASADSKLNAYLSENKVCDVLSSQELKDMFAAPAEIEIRASSFRDTFSCSYKWPRADKAEREKNLVSSMMASMSGNGPKLSMRDRMFDHEVTVMLKKSQRTAEMFVPKKLSEEEINRQIDSAKKRTDERLSDEQKDLAGDAANSMIESMLRKSNQNKEVSGVGDAAYWSSLATGSLEVLDGDVRLTVNPVVADTKAEDLENAKRVALAVLE